MASKTKKLEIFISHSSADTDIAGTLEEWIHSTFLGGVSIFASSDGRSITPGDDWRATIEKALREAEIALIVCTESSLSRPWLGFEAGAAWMRNARVVPLCYHGLTVDSLPLPFAARQGIDLGKKTDVDELLRLLISAGGFDPSLVDRKELSLPQRRPRLLSTPQLDVRATVDFAWLGDRTARFSNSFGNPRPAFVFRVENHGPQPVYLEGGVDIMLKDGRGKGMLREFDNVPFLRTDLLPGKSEQAPLRLDEMSPDKLATWDYAFFRDQIGREFVVDRDALERAKGEFTKWHQSRLDA